MKRLLPKGARAIYKAIVESKSPKSYVKELRRISNYRYYSLRVRSQAQEILDRILCKKTS